MYFLIPFGISFILYLITLAPTVYNLDSAELTTAAATLGLTRSTGYPLYILLGNLWSKLPFGDVGYRLNLFSAFSGALTIGLLAIILKRLRVNTLTSICALGLLATSKFFWALSSIAEVYTFQTMLMAGLILSILFWQEHPSPFWTALIGLLLGLCMCNHAASVLMIPAIVLFFLSSKKQEPYKSTMLGSLLLGLFVGLTPYLYLPLRYSNLPSFNYAGTFDAYGQFHPINLTTFKGLWILLSGQSFSNSMFAYSFTGMIKEIRIFIDNLWLTFLVIGIGPGFLGAYLLFKRNVQIGILLGTMFLFHALFFINYQVIDKETMFLPNYLIWAIWLGVGYQWLFTRIAEAEVNLNILRRISISKLARWTLNGFIVVPVLISVIWNYQLVNQSESWDARSIGEKILSQVEPHALIFGYWNVVPVIEYLKLVEKQRPDVQAINRFLISQEDLNSWIVREISTRPIYIDNCPSALPANIKCNMGDELYYLSEISP